MINPFNHELLLKSIIGDDPPFNIALDNNQIHITAESKEAIIAIQQRLKNNFNSTDELQKTLKYKISTANVQTKTISESVLTTEAPPIPDASAEAVTSLLGNLIDTEVLNNNGVFPQSIFNPKFATVDKGVVFSKPTQDVNLAASLRNNMEYIMRFFADVSIADIHQILKTPNLYLPEPTPEPLDSTTKTAARGLLQECIGLQQFENPMSVVAYFNYKRFLQFLYPPKISYSEINESTFTISLDAEHMIARLKALIQSSVLLKTFKQGKQHYALPIPLGLEPSSKKQAFYTLIIDTSASLLTDDAGSKLKKQVIDFLELLHQKSIQNNELTSSTFIELIFFADNVRCHQPMPLSSLSEIKMLINQQSFDGKTNLCGAIEQSFKNIQNNPLSKNHQNILILFTDGRENIKNPNEIPGIVNKIFSDFKNSGLDIPSFYTLGYGKPDINMLQEISKFTLTPYTLLPKIEDFSKILSTHSHDMTEREILRLKLAKVIDMLNTLTTEFSVFSVPVYSYLGVQPSRVIIPLEPGEPSLNIDQAGKALTVTFNTQDFPVAGLPEKLAKIAADIDMTIRTVDFSDQRSALSALSAELEKLRPEQETSSKHTKDFYNELTNKLAQRLQSSSSNTGNPLAFKPAPVSVNQSKLDNPRQGPY